MLTTFDLHTGTAPLLISMPHVGIELPGDIASRMTPAALALSDTDWYVDRLYDFAPELGAWMLRPVFSRYVIDLNRPPDGALLYPGLRETSLCPVATFGAEALYQSGKEPRAEEVTTRIETYWRPYHTALESALQSIRQRFGYALLWDAHSIRSRCPLLFEGRLPDFNLGTGANVAPLAAAQELLQICESAAGRSAVLNGRFKGGYITRHYGALDRTWAIQLELAQCNYLDEDDPRTGLTNVAASTRALIRKLLARYLEQAQASFAH